MTLFPIPMFLGRGHVSICDNICILFPYFSISPLHLLCLQWGSPKNLLPYTTQ